MPYKIAHTFTRSDKKSLEIKPIKTLEKTLEISLSEKFFTCDKEFLNTKILQFSSKCHSKKKKNGRIIFSDTKVILLNMNIQY